MTRSEIRARAREALVAAIDKVGSQAELARLLTERRIERGAPSPEVVQARISLWLNRDGWVPPWVVQDVVDVAGVAAADLRPDVFS